MAETRGLGVAFLAALTLHLGALGALALWRSSDALHPPGEQLVTIDLAPAMQDVESLAPANVMSLPESEEQEQVNAVQVEAKEVDAAEFGGREQKVDTLAPMESVPVEEIPPSESEAIVALPSPIPVTAQTLDESKPVSKPVKPPVAKTVERELPSPKHVKKGARPSDPHQGQTASSRENLQGAAAAADPNVLSRYAATLAATLRNRLRYPEIARSQGISGVASLRFTMHRSGQITGASLTRSTGSSALDAAALAVARPGTDLPPAPDSLPQQQFTFSVPLRFNLR